MNSGDETYFINDIITVIYPNGYSEKWQFQGAHASIQWKRVPNTLMKDGKPVTPPSNKPATPVGGSVNGATNLYNGPSYISVLENGWVCYGISTVSVQNVDGSWLSSSGTFTYPCY